MPSDLLSVNDLPTGLVAPQAQEPASINDLPSKLLGPDSISAVPARQVAPAPPLTDIDDIKTKFTSTGDLNNDEWRTWYNHEQTKPVSESVSDTLTGVKNAASGLLSMPVQAIKEEADANNRFGQAVAQGNPGQGLLDYIGGKAATYLESVAKAGQIVPQVGLHVWDELKKLGVNPAQTAEMLAQFAQGNVLTGAPVAAALNPDTEAQYSQRVAAFQQAKLAEAARAQSTVAPQELLGGYTPEVSASEAASMAFWLPAWEAGATALGLRGAAEAPGVVQETLARAGQRATGTEGGAALRGAGSVAKVAGGAARAVGAAPRNAIESLAEVVAGPESAEKAATVAEALGLTHFPAARALAALEGVGAGVRTAGELLSRLGGGNSVYGRFYSLARDPQAPLWMRRIVNMPISKGLAGAADAGLDLAKGAGEGAVAGAGFGALTSDSDEEMGQNIGGMALYGLAGRALNLPFVRQQKLWQAARGAAVDLVVGQLARGVSPETLSKVGDTTFANMAAFKTLFPGCEINVADAGQYNAAAGPGMTGSAGFARTSPDGNVSILLNADCPTRGAETTFWHEAFHAAYKSVAANRPDLLAHVDALMAKHGVSLDSAKMSYAERMVAPSLGEPPTSDPAALSAWGDQLHQGAAQWLQQHEAGMTPEQRATWMHEEILSEAAARNLWGTNMAEVASPGPLTRLGEKLTGKVGPESAGTPSTVLGKSMEPVLDDPALKRALVETLRTQKDYLPGISKPVEQVAPLARNDVGTEKSPMHVDTDGEQVTPYGKMVNTGKTDAAGQPVKKFAPFSPREQRRRLVNEQAALNRHFPKGKAVTEVPDTALRDPDITPWTRDALTQLKTALASGQPLEMWYHRLNAENSATSSRSWAADVSRSLGNVMVSRQRGFVNGLRRTANGNLIADWASLEAATQKAQVWAGRSGPVSLELWGGDQAPFFADSETYLKNHAAGLSGDSNGIGAQKRDALNAFWFGQNKEFQAKNPLRENLRGSDRQGVFRSLRVDRMEGISPAESDLSRPNWEKGKINFSPATDRPETIRAAAVRDTETGKTYEAPMHFLAYQEAENDGHPVAGTKWQEGFATNGGEFLDRKQAYQRAKRTGQVDDTFQTDGRWYDQAQHGALSEGLQFSPANEEERHPAFPFPIAGDAVNKPTPSYAESSAGKGNPWVRKSAEGRANDAQTNEARTLAVQFASDLLYKGAQQDTTSGDYYDKLYSGARKGYARMADFWEIPQWIGFAAHFLPDMDTYVVRDLEQAKQFLNEAKYGHVLFSALDVNKALIKELAGAYNGKFDVGGYTDPKTFSDNPNVTWHNSMESLAQSMGVPYTKGVDYRHFAGSDVIPRLTMSTGCKHKCAFCSIEKELVPTSREVVDQQADAIAGLGTKLVYLNDKTFGQAPNYRYLADLNERIKAKNPGFKGFVIQTTAAQMTKFDPAWLKKSGIRFVELGIETYNDPILHAMHKPATEALMRRSVQALREANIALIPNIMIGLPGETADTYARTMGFLKENADIISHANIYNLAVYDNTDLAKQLTTAAPDDFNENVLEKSWMKDPKVHQEFAGDLYGYAKHLLDEHPKSTQFSPSAEGRDPDVQDLRTATSLWRGALGGAQHTTMAAAASIVDRAEEEHAQASPAARKNDKEPKLTDAQRLAMSVKTPLPVYHFSDARHDLTEVDPAAMRAKTLQFWGKTPKSFFWTSPMKEPVVTPFGNGSFPNSTAYRGEIDGSKLYDARPGSGDPLGYFSKWTTDKEAIDQTLLKAGYSGVLVGTKDGRSVVVSFDKVPVKPMGSTDPEGYLHEGTVGQFSLKPGLEPAVKWKGKVYPKYVLDKMPGYSEANKLENAGVLSLKDWVQPDYDNPSKPAGYILPRGYADKRGRWVEPRDAHELVNAQPAEEPKSTFRAAAARRGALLAEGATHTEAVESLIRKGAFPGVKSLEQFEGLSQGHKNRLWKSVEMGFTSKNGEFVSQEEANKAVGRHLHGEDLQASPAGEEEPTPEQTLARYETSDALAVARANAEKLAAGMAAKAGKQAQASPSGEEREQLALGLREHSEDSTDRAKAAFLKAREAAMDLARWRRDNVPPGYSAPESRKLSALEEAAAKARVAAKHETAFDVAFCAERLKNVAAGAPKRADGSVNTRATSLPRLSDLFTADRLLDEAKHRARMLDQLPTVAYSPSEEGPAQLAFGGEEERKFRNVVGMTVEELKAHYPEAVIPNKRDDLIDYNIIDSPLVKKLGGEEASVKPLADKLVEEARKWEKNPVFQSGLKWYSDFVPQLKRAFHKHADTMAQLLAATSPRTDPQINFAFAHDAMVQHEKGLFDKKIAKYDQGREMLARGTLERWYKARATRGELGGTPPANPGPATWLGEWVVAHDLLPRQSNGKLFGMHSMAVLDVLSGHWLEDNEGPKVKNFVQNLTGEGHEATVDVWAARLMRRLTWSDNARWRILPSNETGVGNRDFFYSQKVFRAAAEKLGVEPDALQGAMWFAEKQHWDDNGWQKLDLGDYRRELPKMGLLRHGVEQRLDTQKAVKKAKHLEQEMLFSPGTGESERLDAGAVKESMKKFTSEKTVRQALRGSGWAILTATTSAGGEGTSKANEARNADLRKDLEAAGIPFIPITGSYKGVSDGTSFIIEAKPAVAAELGKKYGQESVLLPRGLFYMDGSGWHKRDGKILVGPAAEKQDYHSKVIDGPAFSVGLDFSEKVK